MKNWLPARCSQVKPFADPEEFRRTLETSLANVDTYVDLVSAGSVCELPLGSRTPHTFCACRQLGIHGMW